MGASKVKQSVIGLVLAALVSGQAVSSEKPVQNIEVPESFVKMLREKYPNTKITSISGSEIPGLYEVIMGRSVAYVEESGRYFVFGHIFDMEKREDVTALRMESRARVNWENLPLEASFTVKKGDGSRKLAVFTDPDCPYCKKLEHELSKIDNVTIHYFLMPLDGLHPQARAKAESVWCSKDRYAAWQGLMSGQQVESQNCNAPIDTVLKFAQDSGIQGTPALIRQDGKVLPGYVPQEKLEAWLNGGG